MHITAILLSGGQGRRMESPLPKQYLPISDRPIALHSFHALSSSPDIAEIIVVCKPEYQQFFPTSLFANPGPRRQDSLFSGMQSLPENCTHILVHDAARPFLDQKDLQSLVIAAQDHEAAALAVPVTMTIKQADENLFVQKTLDRSLLYEIQTPQIISRPLLEKAFADRKNADVTDDVSLIEELGYPVKLVLGSDRNAKITTRKDLAFAEYVSQV